MRYSEATPEQRAKARSSREKAAAKYRPEYTRLLLVAEAPPSELDRYFYFEDVVDHDALFRYVVREVLGREPTRRNKRGLLTALREKSVFLIDLKIDPVDGAPLRDHVDDLVARCRRLRPEKVVLIKATVYDIAFESLDTAGLPVVAERIPFPSSGRQKEFEVAFRRALQAKP